MIIKKQHQSSHATSIDSHSHTEIKQFARTPATKLGRIKSKPDGRSLYPVSNHVLQADFTSLLQFRVSNWSQLLPFQSESNNVFPSKFKKQHQSNRAMSIDSHNTADRPRWRHPPYRHDSHNKRTSTHQCNLDSNLHGPSERYSR